MPRPSPADPGTVAPPDRRWTPLDDQRLRFLLGGTFNTIVGISIFAALQLTVGRVVHYLVVLVVAHVLSVLAAFCVQRTFVFRVRGTLLRDLVRFQLVYLGALAVNLAVLPLLVELAHLPVITAQALAVLVIPVISYFGHKHFSFRRAAP
jgi:putative flippase GtrA